MGESGTEAEAKLQAERSTARTNLIRGYGSTGCAAG